MIFNDLYFCDFAQFSENHKVRKLLSGKLEIFFAVVRRTSGILLVVTAAKLEVHGNVRNTCDQSTRSPY